MSEWAKTPVDCYDCGANMKRKKITFFAQKKFNVRGIV